MKAKVLAICIVFAMILTVFAMVAPVTEASTPLDVTVSNVTTGTFTVTWTTAATENGQLDWWQGEPQPVVYNSAIEGSSVKLHSIQATGLIAGTVHSFTIWYEGQEYGDSDGNGDPSDGFAQIGGVPWRVTTTTAAPDSGLVFGHVTKLSGGNAIGANVIITAEGNSFTGVTDHNGNYVIDVIGATGAATIEVEGAADGMFALADININTNPFGPVYATLDLYSPSPIVMTPATATVDADNVDPNNGSLEVPDVLVDDIVSEWESTTTMTSDTDRTPEISEGQSVVTVPFVGAYGWSFTVVAAISVVNEPIHFEELENLLSVPVDNNSQEVMASDVKALVEYAGGSIGAITMWVPGSGYAPAYTGNPVDDFMIEVGYGCWLYIMPGSGVLDAISTDLVQSDYAMWDLANGDSHPQGEGISDGQLIVNTVSGDHNLICMFSDPTAPPTVVGYWVILVNDNFNAGARGFVTYRDAAIQDYVAGAIQLDTDYDGVPDMTPQSWNVVHRISYWTNINDHPTGAVTY